MSTCSRGAGFLITAVFMLLVIQPGMAGSQQAAANGSRVSRPWNNNSLTPVQRANLLIKQMTLDEKIAIVHLSLIHIWFPRWQ